MASEVRDLKSLFNEALDRPAGPDRSAYLDGACRGDAVLRAQVEELLAAHDRAGRFLAGSGGTATSDPSPTATAGDLRAPAADLDATVGATAPDDAATAAHAPTPAPATARPLTEGPGTCIGPYKLLQKVGEGGMGVVYMAEQERPVRRRVALKIIKAGMDSEQVVARFEAERQALALMDHPNIARVLDAGQTDTGRPFFVMELVNGVPVTTYCDEARLSPQARLELFVPVCQAVQHAHQKGVIHRDIKPSNVLVTVIDGRPVPKVIDFGIAKATEQRLTERSLFTQFGAVVGTLEYMSPEQASLSGVDVDTRADVYSLGVLLYELLTGTTPLERSRLRQAAYAEILQQIREEEPPKPSTRLSSSGDRLPSIAATRGTEPSRLSRLVRGDLDWVVMKALEKDRSRRYETANSFARDVQRFLDCEAVEASPPSRSYRLRKFAARHSVALATAAAFAGLLVTAAAVSVALAVRAKNAERAERASAGRARAEAARALKAETQARAQAENARRSEVQATVEAEKAKAVNDFLTKDLLTQAEPANSAAEDHVTLVEVLDRAADKVGERFAAQPGVELTLRATIARTYHGLASLQKAERQYRAVTELARQRLGPEAPGTFQAQGELAHILWHRGRSDGEVLALARSAAEGLERTLGPDHPETQNGRDRIAEVYLSAGRTDEAIKLYEDSLKIEEAKLGLDHPDTLASRNNLAGAYLGAGRTTEAIRLYEPTLKASEAKLGPDHPATLATSHGLASAYLYVGRAAEATRLLERTLKARESKLGPDHPDTLTSRNNLAEAYGITGQTAEATRLLERTLKARESKLGPDHPDTLVSRSNLAGAYLGAGRTTEAIRLYEPTLKASEAKLGPDHPDTMRIVHYFAHALWHDQPERAEPLFRRALAYYRQAERPDDRMAADLTIDLVNLLLDTGRAGDGEAMCREATARLVRAPGGTESPEVTSLMSTLGRLLLTQRRWSEAEPVLRRCLAVREATQPSHWSTFNTRSLLGGCLLGQGRYSEAEPLIISGYERLKACAATIPSWNLRRLRDTAERVVRLYEAWGKPDKAAEWKARLGMTDLPADVFASPPK